MRSDSGRHSSSSRQPEGRVIPGWLHCHRALPWLAEGLAAPASLGSPHSVQLAPPPSAALLPALPLPLLLPPAVSLAEFCPCPIQGSSPGKLRTVSRQSGAPAKPPLGSCRGLRSGGCRGEEILNELSQLLWQTATVTGTVSLGGKEAGFKFPELL